MTEETISHYLYDRPGHYQIRILGALDERWLTFLEDMEISTTPWDETTVVTQITGRLPDQAALAGLLDLVSDLGLVILSLLRLEPQAGSDDLTAEQPLP